MTRWIVTGVDLPTLVFEYVGGACKLREMWPRAEGAAYVFAGSCPARAETRGTVITLTAVRAD